MERPHINSAVLLRWPVSVSVSAKLPNRPVAPFPLLAGAVLISPIVLPVRESIQVGLCQFET